MSKNKNGLPDDVNADSPNPGEGRSNDEGIITESAGGVKQAPPATGETIITGLPPDLLDRLNRDMLDQWVLPEARRMGYKVVWLRVADSDPPTYALPHVTAEDGADQIGLPLKRTAQDSEKPPASDVDWEKLRADPEHLLLDAVEMRLPGKTPPKVLLNEDTDREVFRWGDLYVQVTSEHPGTQVWPAGSAPKELEEAAAALAKVKRPYGLIVWDLVRGRLYTNISEDVLKAAAGREGTGSRQVIPLENHNLRETAGQMLMLVPTLETMPMLRRGLQDGGGWAQKELSATYTDPKLRGVFLEVREPDMRSVQESVFGALDGDALANALRAMDDVDADLFDLLTAAALQQARPTADPTVVYFDTLFEGRGRKTNTGSYRIDYPAYVEKVLRMCNTFIRGTARHKRRGKCIETAYDAKLLVMRGQGPPLQPELGQPASEQIGFIRYTLGDWAEALQSPAGKNFFGYMLRLTCELDPWKQKVEKRLLRYFAWLWRCRASDRAMAQPVTVLSVLEGAGLLTECEAAEQSRHGGDFRARFEKALNYIDDQNALGTEGWYYLTADGEKRTESADLGLPRKKSMDAWKRARLVVTPPPAIRLSYKDLPDQHQVHRDKEFAALERGRKRAEKRRQKKVQEGA